jgi:hypothetical protein
MITWLFLAVNVNRDIGIPTGMDAEYLQNRPFRILLVSDINVFVT